MNLVTLSTKLNTTKLASKWFCQLYGYISVLITKIKLKVGFTFHLDTSIHFKDKV